MSLSSHLETRDSPVREFLYGNFPNTLPVVVEANKILRKAKTIRPVTAAPEVAQVRPGDNFPYPYAEIGTAIDYRIRYYFPPTREKQLVAHTGGFLLAHKYRRMSQVLVKAFFASLEETLVALGPPRRQLRHDEEAALNRYCFLLALFEQVRRMPPSRLDRSLLFLSGEPTSLSGLLAIPKVPWLEDMESLSRLFFDKYCQHILHSRYVLNPKFEGSADIGGADADLILDTCLLDIKTMIEPRVQNRNLYQLLGYALLDIRNQYELDEVGFYFSRQGTTVTWPLTDLLDNLCADLPRPRLAELRARFRALLVQDANQRDPRGIGGLGPMPTPLVPPAWIANAHPAAK